MTDIIERLRFAGHAWVGLNSGPSRMVLEAADEIERLRRVVAKWQEAFALGLEAERERDKK